MKCWRVWYDNGAAVLVDAVSEEEARREALRQAKADGYPGLGVKRVECLG